MQKLSNNLLTVLKIMHLKDFRQYIQKKSQKNCFEYKIGNPASDDLIEEIEQKLSIKFPDQVRLFYQCCDGFKVNDPALEILPLEKITKDENGKILFSIFDEQHKLCFETTKLNDANQWNIINCSTRYNVTLSMASFWSNKIWAWIDKKRTIWKKEVYC